MRAILFTDLDGCLLNHHDYAFDEALPALEELARRGIPVIINTSKTRAEVEPLRMRMGLDGPFIVENGGGVFVPARGDAPRAGGRAPDDSYRITRLGTPYAVIREFIASVREEYGLAGFGDMPAARLAELTGLSPEEAAAAKQREFSEPFLLRDAHRLDELAQHARDAGLAITRGGRFFHFMGSGQDKGRAVRALIEGVHRHPDGPVRTMAIGNGENDLPMLAQVDLPCLLPGPDGTFVCYDDMRVMRGNRSGARGWREAVDALLAMHGVT